MLLMGAVHCGRRNLGSDIHESPDGSVDVVGTTWCSQVKPSLQRQWQNSELRVTQHVKAALGQGFGEHSARKISVKLFCCLLHLNLRSVRSLQIAAHDKRSLQMRLD